MADYVLGVDCKMYRNNSEWATPDFQEVTNARDVTLTLEAGEADVTTRGNGGWEAVVAALKKGAVEFEMIWNKQDENFQAFRDAWLNRTPIEVMVLDGSKDVAGSEGLRAMMAVIKFTRNEELAEAVKASVTIKPTYSSHAAAWVTMPLS